MSGKEKCAAAPVGANCSFPPQFAPKLAQKLAVTTPLPGCYTVATLATRSLGTRYSVSSLTPVSYASQVDFSSIRRAPLVVRRSADGPATARTLRALGVRQSRTAFSRMMMRLVVANYVSPQVCTHRTDEQTVRQCRYEITDLGVIDWTAARKFYLNFAAALGRSRAGENRLRRTGRLRPRTPQNHPRPAVRQASRAQHVGRSRTHTGTALK